MGHLFFYKKTNKETGKEYQHCLNVEKIVRAEEIGENFVVLMDDGHDHSFDLPYTPEQARKNEKLKKEGKPEEPPKRVRQFIVSEIPISLEDAKRLQEEFGGKLA